uniref:hypothetical protein n=1 Tax=Nonomuraea sp. CA-251285 TaxID=3240002 RepID=UPI003F499AB0
MPPKRDVEYDGKWYKVRSDKIEIPDFAGMTRFAALQWLSRHTYARGFSRPRPLAGLGAVLTMKTR